MAENRRRVVGSYDNRKDAVSVIQRLKEDGYQKDEITVYTSAEQIAALEDIQDAEVATEATVERSRDKDDRSYWEEIKGMFSNNVYDFDTESQDPNYTQDSDILYPHRADIAAGKIVIVIENYREDTDLETSRYRPTIEDFTVGDDVWKDERDQ